MSKNRKAADTFANQFDPPLLVTGTEQINGVAVKDAYAVNYHDPAAGLGIVAVFWGDGLMKGYLEAAGNSSKAKEAGKVFAAALKGRARQR